MRSSKQHATLCRFSIYSIVESRFITVSADSPLKTNTSGGASRAKAAPYRSLRHPYGQTISHHSPTCTCCALPRSYVALRFMAGQGQTGSWPAGIAAPRSDLPCTSLTESRGGARDVAVHRRLMRSRVLRSGRVSNSLHRGRPVIPGQRGSFILPGGSPPRPLHTPGAPMLAIAITILLTLLVVIWL